MTRSPRAATVLGSICTRQPASQHPRCPGTSIHAQCAGAPDVHAPLGAPNVSVQHTSVYVQAHPMAMSILAHIISARPTARHIDPHPLSRQTQCVRTEKPKRPLCALPKGSFRYVDCRAGIIQFVIFPHLKQAGDEFNSLLHVPAKQKSQSQIVLVVVLNGDLPPNRPTAQPPNRPTAQPPTAMSDSSDIPHSESRRGATRVDQAARE